MKNTNTIAITIESLKSIKGDVNKNVATYLKQRGINVLDADVVVTCPSEPGRIWVKRPGKSSVDAYG
ncbi:MAG: hypothetical protein LBE22_10420 [Azoarcus sp.]|jgi:hypothetical protein|nr:hypothetical protein [Azoarcus sp.]